MLVKSDWVQPDNDCLNKIRILQQCHLILHRTAKTVLSVYETTIVLELTHAFIELTLNAYRCLSGKISRFKNVFSKYHGCETLYT